MQRREFITLLGSTVAVWPLAARAQSRGKVFRIEVLGTIPWTAAVDVVRALRESLRERGYIEGQNITINFRGPEQISGLTKEHIDNSVDVIVAWTTPSVLAARRASLKIPIVMVGVADPVALGLVDSLARPGGNVTGVSNIALDLSSKLVELLKEMVPNARRIGVLRSPNNPGVSLQFRETETAIRALNLDFKQLLHGNPTSSKLRLHP